jgi:predicted SAM-dependent methyltransferase
MSEQRTVLHVGCGPKTIENMPAGFRDGTWREVRFDIDPNAKPDFVGTITDMSAVESESVDALFSSHNIEHVYPHEVQGVLAEFRRVLKPKGFVVIACPDLQSLGELIAQGKLEDTLYDSPGGPVTPLDMIYGHIASVERGQLYMAHKTGFTAATMQRHAERAGFADMVLCRRSLQMELWLVAHKAPSTKDELVRSLRTFGPEMARASN